MAILQVETRGAQSTERYWANSDTKSVLCPPVDRAGAAEPGFDSQAPREGWAGPWWSARSSEDFRLFMTSWNSVLLHPYRRIFQPLLLIVLEALIATCAPWLNNFLYGKENATTLGMVT